MAVTVSSLMAAVDQTLNEKAAHIERVHGSYWGARSDVIRNLVAVGAAIFAGTVTFIDRSASSLCTIEGLSLAVSWILLLASISAGLFVLWQSVTLRSFYPKLFNSRPQLREQFEALDLTQPDAVDRSAEVLERTVAAVVGAMGLADARAQLGARVCLISFLGSMLCFLVYAGWRVATGT